MSPIWSQSYTLFGRGLAFSAVLASLPILVLLFLLGVRRKPAWFASLFALLFALVIVGAEFTVNVKLCEAGVPTPLLAVKVKEYVPPVPAAGVPPSAPVPFPLSARVAKAGNCRALKLTPTPAMLEEAVSGSTKVESLTIVWLGTAVSVTVVAGSVVVVSEPSLL